MFESFVSYRRVVTLTKDIEDTKRRKNIQFITSIKIKHNNIFSVEDHLENHAQEKVQKKNYEKDIKPIFFNLK